MSGIAVIWNRDGAPVDRAHLMRMTDLLAHRGPDGVRHRFMGALAIAHRALNITPESVNEEQPLADEAAGLCLTFDGRIDNRNDLKKTLLEGDPARAGISDAALVLAAYRKWADRCPEYLLGDFAFAIWDERCKRLLCARDPMGMRPLFYATVGNTFLCASELRALLGFLPLRSEPNLAMLAARLMREEVDFEDTFYKGVWRLAFAHRLTVTVDAVRRSRYWDIDPHREVRYRSDDEYAEHFRELFFDAMECRLRSAAPIASLLSGGLDSSSMVCAAQEIRRRHGITQPKFETFSMAFDRLAKCDERPFINQVARHCGITANIHVADPDLEAGFLTSRWRLPGLFYTLHAAVMSPILVEMKAKGFRILLDGNGGDELAGFFFPHMVSLTRRGKWLSVLAFLREFTLQYDIPLWKLVLDHAIRPSLPAPVRKFYRWMRPAKPARDWTLVRPEAIESSGVRERMVRRSKILEFDDPHKSQMYGALFTGVAPTMLGDSYELNVAHFGIEMRQPFHDRRLVEFSFALPFDQLWRDGWSRFAFRNAMKGILPEGVRLRRGKGMFVPMYDSVLAGSRAEEVRALFHDPIIAQVGVGNPGAIRAVVDAYQRDPSVLGSAMRVSELIGLEMTYREILGEDWR